MVLGSRCKCFFILVYFAAGFLGGEGGVLIFNRKAERSGSCSVEFHDNSEFKAI